MTEDVNTRLCVLTLLCFTTCTLISGVPVLESGSDAVQETEDNSVTAKDVVDPVAAMRQTARNSGGAPVDASDLQELRDRANANASHSLSNTSLADLESDNLTQLLQLRYRERKRQERLLVIQTQILQRLRMSRQPNISASVFSEEEQRRINAIVERMHQFNNGNGINGNPNSNNDNNGSPRIESIAPFEPQMSDDSSAAGGARIYRLPTMQRLQSFYPSCSLPNNTDRSTWELPGTFRVYYELPFSRYSLRSEVTILLAKLRLYKIVPSTWQRWDPNMQSLPSYNFLDALIHNSPTTVINVSVYQYVKPLRFNRKERKRLVDSRTLALEHEGWVEFNVASSLNHWLHHHNRNFGFDVEVEDAFGNKLNPNHYFRNMNCSATEETPQDPPFPNIMELHPEMMGENESSLFDNETYPTLDLQTADVTTLDAAAFHLYQSSPFANGGETNKRVMRKRHLHQHQHQHHDHQRHQHQRHQHQNSIEEEESVCKKEVVHVNFSDLDLGDTIVAPDSIEWTFCSGGCGTHDSSQSSLRPQETELRGASSPSALMRRLSSLLRHLLFRLPQQKQSPRCTATAKQPLTVLYYNNDHELEETVLEDLVPTECSCSSS